MTFQTILFKNLPKLESEHSAEYPEFFTDLNLDFVVKALLKHKQDYNLRPIYCSPLHDEETIYFRHEIMRDLEEEVLLQAVKQFSGEMVLVRRYLNMITELQYPKHINSWHLETASHYAHAVKSLSETFTNCAIGSCGLLKFREFLTAYTASQDFSTFLSEIDDTKRLLNAVKYCLLIKDSKVKVRKYEGEIDYSQEVQKTFEKFKQGDVKNYRIDLTITGGMNHVQAQILERVARFYPDEFQALDRFCAKYRTFVDEKIQIFDREIQFYIAYLDFIEPIKQNKLPFSYPKVSSQSKAIGASDAFDLALAASRVYSDTPIICNDFQLQDPERIMIISGPNQGGKTTFARMFGQLHYLASLGLPVPARKAQLFIPDRIFTHFEKEEDIRNLRGKLLDDLVRIQSILSSATGNSLIIMNEIFTSTSLEDAIFMSVEIINKISTLDALSVCVSFIDELSRLNPKTVSMVSTIVPENPAVRTFKILRKPSDGLSYAISIAQKHQLTYEQIKERIGK